MCQAARCKLVATLLCTWRPREQLDHKSRTKCFASLPSEWNCTGTVTVGYQSIHRHELDPVLVRLGPPLLLPIHPTGHVSESFFSQRGKHIPRTRDHSDRQQNWIKIQLQLSFTAERSDVLVANCTVPTKWCRKSNQSNPQRQNAGFRELLLLEPWVYNLEILQSVQFNFIAPGANTKVMI